MRNTTGTTQSTWFLASSFQLRFYLALFALIDYIIMRGVCDLKQGVTSLHCTSHDGKGGVRHAKLHMFVFKRHDY
jgi:hypothetical protein